MRQNLTFIIIIIFFLFNGCKTTPQAKSNYLKPSKAGSESIGYSQGLIGANYSGDDLTRLDEARILKSLNIIWNSSNSFGNDWSAQWEGYLTSPYSGQIKLFAETDQELIVALSENEILNVPYGSGSDSATIVLKKGCQYHINVKYLQKSKGPNGETFFKLQWSWNGLARQDIPGESIHFSSEQEGKWKYIGENYKNVFNYVENRDYPLDPIQIKAPELSTLDFSKWTGGLPIVPGIQTFTICIADREHPEKAEGLGYTYQHHQDIAAWHGRLYVGWNTCKVDEDEWPSREVLSTSVNGMDWSKPVEMFPQGISTPLRIYFYLAPNGRMLVIAGLRENRESLSERRKSGIVVREIFSNHTFGDVYTLRNAPKPVEKQPPFFEVSSDKGFVEACHQLLDDHLFLSQQDYGVLLDPKDRMKWFNPSNWQGDDQLRDIAMEFGKAMCFFERDNGTIVALSKRRWVTTSLDGGKTWTQPVRPKSLITGGGKVWGQQIPDGRYLLIYNPDQEKRWPLLMLTSNDGIIFSNPMSINGELPKQRYEGKFKDIGVSYHRGLNKWNNDGSWKDDGIWLVYSLNKEDILISRIPASL
jgi:hypothetical protein